MSESIRTTVYAAEARETSDDQLAALLDAHFADHYARTTYYGLSLVREASARLRARQAELEAANLALASVRSLVCP